MIAPSKTYDCDLCYLQIVRKTGVKICSIKHIDCSVRDIHSPCSYFTKEKPEGKA